MSRDVTLLDHAVVLQTERALNVLEDKVEQLGEQVADSYCECNCAEDGLDIVHGELKELRQDLMKTRERMAKLMEILIEHLGADE